MKALEKMYHQKMEEYYYDFLNTSVSIFIFLIKSNLKNRVLKNKEFTK